MAYINVNEVYVLDNTGLQVDMATDIPFTDAGFSDAQKAQARKNIAAGGSNRNLLDNGYFVGGGSQLGNEVFPINQREQASYAGAATTTFDRWWVQYNTTATLTSTGVRLTGSWDFDQDLPSVLPADTYTLSVDVAAMGSTGAILMFVDANNQLIQSFPIDHTGINTATITSDQIKRVGINLARPNGDGDLTVRAMKLEEGTVSTLANDGPPDFWTELKKCMRRFRRIKAEAPYYIFATVLAETVSYAVGMIDLPVPMASKPTISTNGSFRFWTGTGENPVAVSSIGIFDAVCPSTNCSRIGIIAYPSVNLTADARYDLQANSDVNAYIDLSCES